MPKRKRRHQVCLRLSDEELLLLNKKCAESGLSKTDLLISLLNGSTVKVFHFDDEMKELIYELRHIGSNINQLAFFSNVGQEQSVRNQIEDIRRRHNLLMEEISEFLKNPKYNRKCSET